MSDFNISWTYTAIDKLSAPLDAMESKMDDLTFAMKTQQKQVEKSMFNIQKFGDKLQSVGKSMSMWITTPLIGIGTAAINAAIEAEKADRKFVAFFQGNKQKAEDLLKVVDDFVYSTGAIKDEKIEAVALRLLQAGVSVEDISGKLKYMSDIALGANIPIETLAQNFKRITDNPKSLARIVKQMEIAGVPLSKALQKVTGLPMKQINNMMKNGAIGIKTYEEALRSLTVKGENYYNATAEASNTLSAAFSNLGKVGVELLEEIGGGGAGATNLTTNIQRITESLRLLKGQISSFTSEHPTLTKIALGFTAIMAAAGPLIFIFGRLLGFAVKFSTAARGGWIGLAIWAAYEACVYLYNEFESVKNIVDTITSTLKSWANYFFTDEDFVGPQERPLTSSIAKSVSEFNPTKGIRSSIQGYALDFLAPDRNDTSEVTININDPSGMVKNAESSSNNVTVNQKNMGSNMRNLFVGN